MAGFNLVDPKWADDGRIWGMPDVVTTQIGDVWSMGDHRLMCGDSRESDQVIKLFDGKHADMVLTDPPYGVNYTGGSRKRAAIHNDGVEDLLDLIKRSFDAAQSVSRPGAYWYATVPGGPLYWMFSKDWVDRGILRQMLVWVKNNSTFGRQEYHYQHEPIMFGWVPGPRRKNPDRTRTTIWEFDRPSTSKVHPTMKPVGLWARAINDATGEGDLIYDPFLGSGTTVIAAEKTSRVCYGMEIDPRYCDVIVHRWERQFGRKAEKWHSASNETPQR